MVSDTPGRDERAYDEPSMAISRQHSALRGSSVSSDLKNGLEKSVTFIVVYSRHKPLEVIVYFYYYYY